MPITELRDSPPINEQALRDMEKRLRVELPAEYRTFLLSTNGGIPHPEQAFGVAGNDEPYSLLNMFYSVEHPDHGFTMDYARRAFKKRIPKDLLPIGQDHGGNLVCIGIGWRNRGRIFFWSMDDEQAPDEKPSYRNVRKLADSFDEFLATFGDVDEQA